MSWFAVTLGVVVVVSVAAIALFTTAYLRSPDRALKRKRQRRRHDQMELLERLRETTCLEARQPTWSGSEVEELLVAGRTRQAVAAAEAAYADATGDAHALTLARALICCGEWAAAEQLLSGDFSGELALDADYLRARTRYQQHEEVARRGASADSAGIPRILCPYELLLIKLEGERRHSGESAALWLAGATDTTLPAGEIDRLLTEHFGVYEDALGTFGLVAETTGTWAEPRYHAARLGIKLGLIERGRALLESIEEQMEASPDRFLFERELAELRDPSRAGQRWELGQGRIELRVL